MTRIYFIICSERTTEARTAQIGMCPFNSGSATPACMQGGEPPRKRPRGDASSHPTMSPRVGGVSGPPNPPLKRPRSHSMGVLHPSDTIKVAVTSLGVLEPFAPPHNVSVPTERDNLARGAYNTI